jgi:deazaflavin-dependent oxidoreductase (nitroreductase family)
MYGIRPPPFLCPPVSQANPDFPTRVGLQLLHVHQAVYVLTAGRIGHHLFGLPCLLLRTTGRRTGRTRTASLVYARDGEDYVVVASLGGSDRAPAWFHNLTADPHVDVQVGRRRFPAIATVIARGDDEYARLWRAVNDVAGGRYDRYQAKTSRPIPLVRLTPGLV